MATTQAADAADEIISLVFNDKEMKTLREKAEECRLSHGGPTHLGANHYFEALVDLGWPDALVVRLKQAMMGKLIKNVP